MNTLNQDLEHGERKFVIDRWERDANNPNAGAHGAPHVVNKWEFTTPWDGRLEK
jgi:hypothetical protein